MGRTELEQEKDSEVVRSRKLVKLVERYKQELHETQTEMETLKARMMENSGIKVSVTVYN